MPENSKKREIRLQNEENPVHVIPVRVDSTALPIDAISEAQNSYAALHEDFAEIRKEWKDTKMRPHDYLAFVKMMFEYQKWLAEVTSKEREAFGTQLADALIDLVKKDPEIREKLDVENVAREYLKNRGNK